MVARRRNFGSELFAGNNLAMQYVVVNSRV